LAGSTSKKVTIRRFEREALSGFVNPQTYLQPAGVELLSTAGAVFVVPYVEVKAVCFVREFLPDNPSAERKAFATRPKKEGLWVRLLFRDGDSIEALIANNLLQVEAGGLTISPPDPYSNNQRMFIPRAALTDVQVLGVVNSPLRHREQKPAAKPGQLEMFD
jgi:hypothetical protein